MVPADWQGMPGKEAGTTPERTGMTKNTKPQIFLSTTEAAEFLGITKAAFLKRRPAPPADAMIASYRGWTKETLRAWDKTIPGPGPRPRNK